MCGYPDDHQFSSYPAETESWLVSRGGRGPGGSLVGVYMTTLLWNGLLDLRRFSWVQTTNGAGRSEMHRTHTFSWTHTYAVKCLPDTTKARKQITPTHFYCSGIKPKLLGRLYYQHFFSPWLVILCSVWMSQKSCTNELLFRKNHPTTHHLEHHCN